jgi:hypothetical protein
MNSQVALYALLFLTAVLACVLIYVVQRSRSAPLQPSGKPEKTGHPARQDPAPLYSRPIEEVAIVAEKADLPPIKFVRSVSQLVPRTQAGSLVSQVIPAATVGTLLEVGLQGVYRATVSPDQLLRYADHSFSSIIQDSGGRISGHAGFIPVTSQVFAPLAAFQAMSIVTGQYYLHAISRQFEQIEKQLQQLILLHHNEKVAVLRAAATRLESLFASHAVTREDLQELTRLQGKAAEIEQEYRQLLAGIDADKYEKIGEGVLSKKAIDNLRG